MQIGMARLSGCRRLVSMPLYPAKADVVRTWVFGERGGPETDRVEAAWIVGESGERGRNRAYNLLIKSYGSRFGCSVDNCSRHNNLMIKRPAWTASENVEKVGGIEPRLAKDTKRTQRDRHEASAPPLQHCAAISGWTTACQLPRWEDRRIFS
jgi:hypothetical protein